MAHLFLSCYSWNTNAAKEILVQKTSEVFVGGWVELFLRMYTLSMIHPRRTGRVAFSKYRTKPVVCSEWCLSISHWTMSAVQAPSPQVRRSCIKHLRISTFGRGPTDRYWSFYAYSHPEAHPKLGEGSDCHFNNTKMAKMLDWCFWASRCNPCLWVTYFSTWPSFLNQTIGRFSYWECFHNSVTWVIPLDRSFILSTQDLQNNYLLDKKSGMSLFETWVKSSLISFFVQDLSGKQPQYLPQPWFF